MFLLGERRADPLGSATAFSSTTRSLPSNAPWDRLSKPSLRGTARPDPARRPQHDGGLSPLSLSRPHIHIVSQLPGLCRPFCTTDHLEIILHWPVLGDLDLSRGEERVLARRSSELCRNHRLCHRTSFASGRAEAGKLSREIDVYFASLHSVRQISNVALLAFASSGIGAPPLRSLARPARSVQRFVPTVRL